MAHEVAAVVHTTSPTTTEPEDPPAEVMLAEETVTVYAVISAPPLLVGAVQLIVVEAFCSDVPTTPVGAPGTVAGVTATEGAEGNEEPIAFVATTLNV
jgi:hypothetical protein